MIPDENIELCEFSKRMLGYLLFWSKKPLTRTYYIKSLMLSIVSYIFTVGMIWNIIRYLETNKFNFVAVGEEIAVSISQTMMMYLFYRHLNYHKDLENILIELGNFRIYEKPIGIDKLNKNVESMTKLFVGSCCICLVLIWLYCMLTDCEDGVEDSCGLVFPAYFSINIYERNRRRLVATSQVVIAFHASQGACFVACCTISPSEYLSNRIMHLTHLIQQIKQMEGRPKRKQHLKKVVQYHQNIIGLWENYCGLINPSLLVLHICAPIIISSIVHQFFYKIALLNVAHLIIYIVITFFAAFIGENISSSCDNLIETTYDCIPFDGDVDTQKDMMLILIRSQRELFLPCGKFTKVNFLLFVSVMKCVYTCLTLIPRP